MAARKQPPNSQCLTGPGLLLDRSCKKGVLKIQFDPSPDGFVGQARGAKEKLQVRIIPESGEMDPIEVLADPKLWAFRLENAHVPPERLADLEHLIAEELGVHIVITYTPQAPPLPGLENGTAER